MKAAVFFIGISVSSAQLVFMKLPNENVDEFCQSIPVNHLLSLSIFTIFLRKIINQLICIFQKQMSIYLYFLEKSNNSLYFYEICESV